MKKNKHVKIEKKNGKEIMSFSALYDLKSQRRELPPPTRVEKPKKGKGSYSRKKKHRSSSRGYDDSGAAFIFPFSEKIPSFSNMKKWISL